MGIFAESYEWLKRLENREFQRRFTTAKLRNAVRCLKKVAIKPYKGYIGLGSEGLFEIKDEAQFQALRENTDDRTTRRQLPDIQG